MDLNDVESKVKTFFSKTAKVSKDAFEKAGTKVQDFSDKSVIKIEKHQLETKRDCKYEELGFKVSQLLLQGAEITGVNSDEIEIVKDIQNQIIQLSDEIAKKENLL